MKKKKETSVTGIRDLAKVALCAALIAVSAWIVIPFPAIPFTMQIFAIALTLFLLGGKRGTVAILVYLALGAVGMPVYSSFGSGFGVLAGATGGFLWGFIPMGLLFWLMERVAGGGHERVPPVWTVLPGLAACYASGTAQFAILAAQNDTGRGIWQILLICVVPYLIPDAVKILLAYGAARLIRKGGIV